MPMSQPVPSTVWPLMVWPEVATRAAVRPELPAGLHEAAWAGAASRASPQPLTAVARAADETAYRQGLANLVFIVSRSRPPRGVGVTHHNRTHCVAPGSPDAGRASRPYRSRYTK